MSLATVEEVGVGVGAPPATAAGEAGAAAIAADTGTAAGIAAAAVVGGDGDAAGAGGMTAADVEVLANEAAVAIAACASLRDVARLRFLRSVTSAVT
jgi:hypothetical protein